MKPLERAKNLLALATGETTPVEEARTAAMALCKMLARGEIVLAVKRESHLIDGMAAYAAGRAAAEQAHDANVKARQSEEDWTGTTDGYARARADQGYPKKGRLMVSLHVGTCTWCGIVFTRGDILWAYEIPSKMIEHEACAKARVKAGKEGEAYA